jgi:hypothetical protein
MRPCYQDCVTDDSGVETCALRTYVANGITIDEELCSDSEVIDNAGYTVRRYSPNSACSVNGLCISLVVMVAEVVKAKVPPVLTLFGPNAVTILEGDPWELCPPGVGFKSSSYSSNTGPTCIRVESAWWILSTPSTQT